MITFQALPDNISYFQIDKLSLEPTKLTLNVVLLNPLNMSERVELDLENLLYFSISKTPDDEEGCYQIGDIQVCLRSDVSSLLDKLNYKFSGANLERSVYHLSIEGDLCLDVVGEKYVMRHIK